MTWAYVETEDGDEDWVDVADYPRWVDSNMRQLQEAAGRVRDSIALSMDTIRSLSTASLDALYQNYEATAALVMSQAEVIGKVLRERS